MGKWKIGNRRRKKRKGEIFDISDLEVLWGFGIENGEEEEVLRVFGENREEKRKGVIYIERETLLDQ